MLRAPFDLRQLLAPGGPVPDLEVVVDARDDDVASQLRVLDQCRRHDQPALLVQLALGRAREEEALHAPPLLRERVEPAEPRLDEPAPVGARVRVEAAVHAARHDDPVRELAAEAGRQREPVLVVDRVLVFAEKHRQGSSVLATFPHNKPRLPTPQPQAARPILGFVGRPTRSRISQVAAAGALLAAATLAAAAGGPGAGRPPPEWTENVASWPAHDFDLSNTRASLGTRIDARDVANLKLRWSFRLRYA